MQSICCGRPAAAGCLTPHAPGAMPWLPVRARACGSLRALPCSALVASCCNSNAHLSSCCSTSTSSGGRVPCAAPAHSNSSTSSSSSRRASLVVLSAHDQHTEALMSSIPQQRQQQQQQQQQCVPTAGATAAPHCSTSTTLPFAALSRVLLTSSNTNVFKSLAQRRQPVSGPMGVLLFLATLIAASFAAIRSLLVKRGKSCKSCRGFGLQRCRLCLGSGRVDWAAKLKHFDVCPLCMNRRFIVCGECGGHYHRSMFAHRRRQAGGAFEPDRSGSSSSSGGFGNDGSEGSFQGPIVLNMAAAGAATGGVTVVTSSSSYVEKINPLLSSMSD